MGMAQLRHWCKGEGIDPEYAILVKDVPEAAEVNVIEETLQSIKALGRVKVMMSHGESLDLQKRKINCQTLEMDPTYLLTRVKIPHLKNPPLKLSSEQLEKFFK
ncbi:hypothetical protein CRENBAI_009971 [Crenichthys baileyi]|uniref:Paraneoplastic antigen Ma-like N-terminal domain-containing protein n=1 Tax=Crenichthys baileyi TaxID=28760 RepID=A0AAV9RUA2_9TELE